jgi:hypothetical protein
MNDSRGIVLTKFSQAEAERCLPVKGVGREPDRGIHWAVYAAPGDGQELLGKGLTEAAAWQDAADNILAEDPQEPR